MPHAIIERTFGGPEVLRYEEEKIPALKEDEVLVSVQAAGVNPVDVIIREGGYKGTFPLPLIPGGDIAGVIERTGERVKGFAVGDAVFGMIGYSGGYAEYAVAKAENLAPKPAILDFTKAAAVPLAALAAWQSLFDLGNLVTGHRVFIQGAAGGVGGFAVQFAHNAGAYVIGTAASQDLAFLRTIGANEAIDYQAGPFEEKVRDIDLVLDLIGGEVQERSWAVLKDGGTFVTTKNEPSAEKALAKKAAARRLMVHADGSQLRQIGKLIDAGHVQVVVTDIFPLEKAGEAHQLLKSTHTRGKIVLKVR